MDAATLYIVLTLPNGEQQTSTQKFPTLQACEAQAEWLRQLDRLDHQLPSTLYRCEGHNRFAFVAPYRRGKSRHLVEFSSRQACRAYQWIAYLRDRSPKRLGYCFEDPPPTQTVPDGFDRLGQPGVPKAQ